MILRLVGSLSSAVSLSLSSPVSAYITRGFVPSSFRGTLHLRPYAFSTSNRIRTAAFSSFIDYDENSNRMPEPPYQYQSSDAPVLDLSDLGAKIIASDQKRQDAYDKSRKFQKAMIEARTDLEQNKSNISESISNLQSCLVEAIGNTDDNNNDRVPRIGNLNQRVEDLCRFMAFHHFLKTGKMLPPSACFESPLKATDEEYLAGACMGLCQDLSRYAMGRATARDAHSVQQARDLVNEILDYLLQFDFRNGFLRRKYDGTKYALKVRKTDDRNDAAGAWRKYSEGKLVC